VSYHPKHLRGCGLFEAVAYFFDVVIRELTVYLAFLVATVEPFRLVIFQPFLFGRVTRESQNPSLCTNFLLQLPAS